MQYMPFMISRHKGDFLVNLFFFELAVQRILLKLQKIIGQKLVRQLKIVFKVHFAV